LVKVQTLSIIVNTVVRRLL